MWYWEYPSQAKQDSAIRLKELGDLVAAAQKDVDDKTIILPSQDPDPVSSNNFEVAVFFPTSYAQEKRFTPQKGKELFERTAREINLPYDQFLHETVENVHSFTPEELNRVFAAAKSSPEWLRKAAEDIPEGQASSSIRIARWRLDRLCKASDKGLAKEMKSIMKETHLENTKAAWVTVKFVVAGIITIISIATAGWGYVQMGSALVAMAIAGVGYGYVTVGSVLSIISPWVIFAGLLVSKYFDADNTWSGKRSH